MSETYEVVANEAIPTGVNQMGAAVISEDVAVAAVTDPQPRENDDSRTIEQRRKQPAPPSPRGDCNANPPGLTLWQLIAEDYRTHESDWTSQGFLALAVHRFGNWRMERPKWQRLLLTPLYRILYKACEIFFGIMLPYPVPIGRRVKIEHFGGIILSARSIGNDVTVRQNTTMGIASKADLHAKPTIEDGVDIGCHVVIVGNITVGRGSVIGAGSVVIRDVPPHSVVAGVPAKVIKTLR